MVHQQRLYVSRGKRKLTMDEFFTPVPEAQQKKEKAKARELRQSSWWKQQVGKGICYHCEMKFAPQDLTMDHLIPIARGGKSNKNNCVPSCKECNTKKGSKTRAEIELEKLKNHQD
jgi:5-methylcytosine-specific restriction protein A